MRRWLWLLPLVLLQACAGTPLAERLERSFAAPDEPVQPPATSPASIAARTDAGLH